MKKILLFSIILLGACGKQKSPEEIDVVKTADTVQVKTDLPGTAISKTYSNDRFRQVTVEKMADDKFRVKGQGQIFEANFSWLVEDGHNELKKGFEMTDAGAPEWGEFDFTLDVAKTRDNSTLTLILFEISAEDGSHQHELMIPLP